MYDSISVTFKNCITFIGLRVHIMAPNYASALVQAYATPPNLFGFPERFAQMLSIESMFYCGDKAYPASVVFHT